MFVFRSFNRENDNIYLTNYKATQDSGHHQYELHIWKLICKIFQGQRIETPKVESRYLNVHGLWKPIDFP